ncbi:MAG TPA: hypothetical protein VMB79_10370 [Jatrophihabitans sp.]|nr:hypothetical protein [Jatrophihabitans sp.]
MSVPFTRQLPRSGLSRPIIDFRNTDFPVPDGPNNALISPAGKVRLTSRQIFWRPKDFVSPSMTTSTPIATP